jgi:16S rRNA (uracil1498-N3)-methyltransferase
LPVVTEVSSTAQVAERVRGAAGALVLHEASSRPLAGMSLPSAGEIFLVVGPEGGVTEAEVAELEAAGAVAVRLGASVLRTSTAGAAAAAVVSALTPRWR